MSRYTIFYSWRDRESDADGSHFDRAGIAELGYSLSEGMAKIGQHMTDLMPFDANDESPWTVEFTGNGNSDEGVIRFAVTVKTETDEYHWALCAI